MHDSSGDLVPLSFLHDAARCLALARQDRLRLTPHGQLSRGSLAALARQACTVALSCSRTSALSYCRFIFDLLGQGGLIGAAGERVLLATTAYDWLDQPPERQLYQLRLIWLLACDADWYQPHDSQHCPGGRWGHLALQSVEALVALPTATWTPISELAAGLEACGPLASRNVALNLPRVRHAIERRTHRFLRFLLLVVLPCLSLIELSEQKVDCLRPTAEGITWMDAALSRRRLLTDPPEGTAVQWDVPAGELCLPRLQGSPITVTLDTGNDVIITVHPAAPTAYTFEIAHFARLTSPARQTSSRQPDQSARWDLKPVQARYQITRETLQRAAAWGYSVPDAAFLVNRYGGDEMPPDATARLSAWGQETMTISYEPGYRLQAAPAIIEVLRQRRAFRSRTRPFVHPRGKAAVQDVWAGQAQAGGLFRYLRRLGYTLVEQRDRDDTDTENRLAIARVLGSANLPLSQLLTALRAYEHLRHALNGLANLGLQDLARDLEVALSPDDLSAVQRLSDSNGALIAEALVAHEIEGQEERVEERERDTDDEQPADQAQPGLERSIRDAIRNGKPLYITYVDTQARITRRRVHPLRLESRWGQQYMVAHCELRQDERRFRLDRIVELITQ